MKQKRTVVTDGVAPAIWYAIGIAEVVYQQETGRLCLVVTSLHDSHGIEPLHGEGMAPDQRNRTQRLTMVGTQPIQDPHVPWSRSLHNVGLAVDLRNRDLTPTELAAIYMRLRMVLEPLGYDVLWEKDPPHFHIEYDPKGQENWVEVVD